MSWRKSKARARGLTKPLTRKGSCRSIPIRKTLDTIANEPLHYDWEALRESIKTHGLRNSTLSALMPSETSSQISNATNGIETAARLRQHQSVERRYFAPGWCRTTSTCTTPMSCCGKCRVTMVICNWWGIMQKFIDQSISLPTPTTIRHASRQEKVPMQQLLKDLLTAYKIRGQKHCIIRTPRDGAEDAQDDLVPSIQDDGCESGACKI